MTDQRVMLITGTRKGIGQYLAEYYAARGFQVIGCSRGPAQRVFENYEHYCSRFEQIFRVKVELGELCWSA